MKLLNIVMRDIKPEDVNPPYHLNTAKEPTRFHRTTSWKFVEYVDILLMDGKQIRKESTLDDPIYVCEGWRGYNHCNDGEILYKFYRPCHNNDMPMKNWYLLKEGDKA